MKIIKNYQSSNFENLLKHCIPKKLENFNFNFKIINDIAFI